MIIIKNSCLIEKYVYIWKTNLVNQFFNMKFNLARKYKVNVSRLGRYFYILGINPEGKFLKKRKVVE
ncbi:hypothetical protein GCM10022291_08340 [Postechiella marina]|uniref:Uncharacterized protein n=1 Tax=Postechiella marina TaxID=943941 RepID=A0ABP8C3C5_9FLAO